MEVAYLSSPAWSKAAGREELLQAPVAGRGGWEPCK